MCRCLLPLLASVLLAGTPAFGQFWRLYDILSLDETRTGSEDEPGPARYLTSPSMIDATNILVASGFHIQTTDRFTTANIGLNHILYTGAVATPFTEQELNDIVDFVARGGNLVLQRDWGAYYAAADDLAARFGVWFDPGPYGIQNTATAVQQYPYFPIWSGPAGSVHMIRQVYSSAVVGAMPVGYHADDPGAAAIAFRPYGAGKVWFLTDMDAWDSIGDPITPSFTNDNGVMWANMFYSFVPEPGTIALLGGVALLAFRRRR